MNRTLRLLSSLALAAAAVAASSSAFAQKKSKVVELAEITITGRVQKPVAAVDISRLAPKLSLGELRQPFLDKIEQAVYREPFFLIAAALALSTLSALLAAAVALARLRAVLSAVDVEPSELARWASRRRDEPHLAALARSLEEAGSPAAPLAGALSQQDARARAGLVNEALIDLEASVGWAEGAPSAALRLCLFATVLSAALLVLGGRPVGRELFDVFALGAGGAVVVLAASRAAGEASKRLRTDIDAWVAAVVPDAGPPHRRPASR